MKHLTIFDLVAEEFNKAQVPFLLIGGFAINAYKISRQTADIDFIIAEEDYPKALAILNRAGYQEHTRQKMFAGLFPTKAGLMDIDLVFVDRNTLTGLIREGKVVKIAGQKLTVPSIEHLLALKLHSIRHNFEGRINKDLPDIFSLLRINKINPKTETFRQLCLKYGNEKIYEKILQDF